MNILLFPGLDLLSFKDIIDRIIIFC